MNSKNLNFNENFSLTSALTTMTNKWYQNSKAQNASYGSLFLGSIGTRIVNILILPTALIDAISHLAVAVITLGFAAPAGKIYNCIQWIRDSNLESKFSFAGGIVNLMNAKKHFNLFLGPITGMINPEKITSFFNTNEGRTQKEIDEIFQKEIDFCENIRDRFKGTSEISEKAKEGYENILTILRKSNVNFKSENVPLEIHEEFSFTRLLTNTTNNWYQKTKKNNADLGSLIIGSIGARIVNQLIMPVALVDSICNIAISIFTLTIGAPLGIVYNAMQWCLNSNLRSRFSFSGGIINIMNAKNHLINAPFATFAGILDPEKAANFFKTSKRKTKIESNYNLRFAILACEDFKKNTKSEIATTACDHRISKLRSFLIP
ncbi:MAG: hypothetical protein H0W50_04825 [Parachlamydiaceae bacterium]|nr:hypothetical protein [Parachlamydiaceae bacterium]